MDKNLTQENHENLLEILKLRFENNMNRHEDIEWAVLQKRLEADPEKLRSLNEMERTGGEPDVVGLDQATGQIIFFDCAAESPDGRRSLCYDHEALESRKKNKPKGSAMGLAAEMGIEILDETQYRDLQKLGEFDMKASSWVKTPSEIRDQGGAVFGDRQFGKVWFYHNGADSYYAARGFRGSLKV